jgi:hypothetical protein
VDKSVCAAACNMLAFNLLYHFQEMASNEEIEAANNQSWPRLAMLGMFEYVDIFANVLIIT